MKLHDHANKLDTNVQNETQDFCIGDVSVVIGILRNNMYKNKVQTLVQEYICNARDAMREVGKGNSFEVTVPTHLNPVFKVKDFGPGVSPDRMANVFIKYGASTKRATNNQTGGFGLGAKSAWSYTDSFTIVSVVDGVKRSYVAHTGVNNNGRLDLVDTVETKEKNGTEIQVAVKKDDVREFRDAVLRAIYFWEDKPTLKGQLDIPTLTPGYRIGSCIETIHANLLPSYIQLGYEDHIALIDGIPYPIESNLLNKCKTLRKLTEFVHEKIIFHIGNGVLEIAASRESISDSPKTVDSLEKIAQKVFLEVKTHISDTFGAVKTPSEYIKVYRELVKAFSIENGFTKYGDYKINNSNIVGEPLKKIKVTKIHCLSRYGRGTKIKKVTKKEFTEDERCIELDLFNDVFFVKTRESMVSQNKRIRQYFESHTKMLLIESLDGHNSNIDKVIKDLSIKDFQTVTYPEVPKEQRVKVSRDKTEFCMHVLSRERHKYTTLSDNSEKWLYIPLTDKGWTTDFNVEQLKELNEFMQNIHGVRICGVAERALKMIDGNSNFSSFKDWVDNYVPTAKEIHYAKRQKSTNSDLVNNLEKAKGIKDSLLNDIVKEYKTIEKSSSGSIPEVLLKKVNQTQEVKDFVQLDSDIKKLVKTLYPLMVEFEGYTRLKNVEEIVYYLNAKFETK